MIEEVDHGTWLAENRILYFFAVLYVANLVGGLVIANPINIAVAKFFHRSFLEYAAWMALPALVSIAATCAGLRLFFRRSLPHRFEPPLKRLMPEVTRLTVVAGAILAVALLAFLLGEPLGLAAWLVASVGALTLLAATALLDRPSLPGIVRGVGWDVIHADRHADGGGALRPAEQSLHTESHGTRDRRPARGVTPGQEARRAVGARRRGPRAEDAAGGVARRAALAQATSS